jgi:glucokinase
MNKDFVVVSGLPCSGKSSLGLQLAPALGLLLLDKDTILESLFESKGVGDAEWRRALSRQSDLILQTKATASNGAVLVSHWHLAGMPLNSGTPTNWLSNLSRRIVNVHCECPADVAARRYVQRNRHPGHLDNKRSYPETLASIRAVAALGRLDIAPCIEVDTSQTPMLDAVVTKVHLALSQCGTFD